MKSSTEDSWNYLYKCEDKDVYTNGHWLLKTDKKIPKRKRYVPFGDLVLNKRIDEMLYAENLYEVDLAYYYIDHPDVKAESNEPLPFIANYCLSGEYRIDKSYNKVKFISWFNHMRSGASYGCEVNFQQVCFNVIKNRYPNATFKINEENKNSLIAYENNKPIGLVMPLTD